MTTLSTYDATVPATRRPEGWVPGRRLVRAELTKLTRRRSLMAAAVFLTGGALALYYLVSELLHLSDAAKYGAAGGIANLGHGVFVLSELGAIAAILIGASVGAADLSAGVFSSLVVTGRSRVALYLGRIPAGALVVVVVVGTGYLVAALASVLLAAPLTVPSVGLLVASGLWIELGALMAFFLSLGVASLVGSRSTTVGILVALTLVVAPIVEQVRQFPLLRQAVMGVALTQLRPGALPTQGPATLTMTTVAVTVVLAAWAAVPLAVGGWRTASRDA